MTKKSLTYLILCALLLLTACSEAIVTLPEEEKTPADVVAFDAYLNRTTSSVGTRAGRTGAIGNDALKGSADGFGVFAFHGNDDWLYAAGTQQPDFMYNQQVTWNGSATAWTYSPLKYWPNETGSDAVSYNTDRLSFFAYAPYVAVIPETGELTTAYTGTQRTTGITAMSNHHHRGDPWVQYVVSYDACSQVDLCWADVDANTLNQTKHSISEPVQLNFHHALSAINVQVDAVVDALSPSSTGLHDNTRIYMRSVTFEGFANSGALNLYNRVSGTPRWIGNYGQGLIGMDAVTIHDGRRDRHEGSGANANEWPTGLNPVVIQSSPYTVNSETRKITDAPRGVTEEAVNLFDVSHWIYEDPEHPTSTEIEARDAAPLYVIPNGQPLRVTVAYDVETYDPSLKYQRLSDDQTYGSSVPNVISSWVRLGGDNLVLEAGKQYTIRLHLGMTSVKVDVVEVKAWEDGAIVDVTIPDTPTP